MKSKFVTKKSATQSENVINDLLKMHKMRTHGAKEKAPNGRITTPRAFSDTPQAAR